MGTYRVAAVWQRACSRASAFRGSGRRPSSTARHGEASIVSVARVVPSLPGSSRISAVNCCWMSRQTRRRSGSTAVITTTPSDSGRLSRPTSPPRATCQRAPSATPRRSGRTEVIAGPPVGEVVRLGEQRPGVRPGRDQLRLGFDPHPRVTADRRGLGASCPGGRSARGDPARREPRRRSRRAPRL